MSEELKAFYLAYAAWLANGAPKHEVFAAYAGLCSNLRWYCQHVRVYPVKLENELFSQFKKAGLDPDTPFNSTGADSYSHQANTKTLHLNPKRIAWVRNQVEKIKESL